MDGRGLTKRRKEVLAGYAREREAGLQGKRAQEAAKRAWVRRVLAEPESLDQDEIKKLLMRHDGNVTECAKRLNVDPARLRAYVAGMHSLKRAVAETVEQGVDQAIAVLYEGLRSDHFQSRYYAAKEFLRTEAARRRGFGRENVGRPSIEVRSGGNDAGTITLQWLEPPAEEGEA